MLTKDTLAQALESDDNEQDLLMCASQELKYILNVPTQKISALSFTDYT